MPVTLKMRKYNFTENLSIYLLLLIICKFFLFGDKRRFDCLNSFVLKVVAPVNGKVFIGNN